MRITMAPRTLKVCIRQWGQGLLFYLLLSCASHQSGAAALAPGYGELGYTLAAPGSYTLHHLGQAPDASVLDEAGQPQQLHDLLRGKYSLLSFIYSNCKDVNGCPLSSYVFYQMKAAMQEQPELAERLRLISLSFDPARDTPQVMRLYAKNYEYAGEAGEWRFLTTASEAALQPILQAYNQEIQREVAVNGELTDDYSHLLRVFLIDPELEIRNIYSVGFLHSAILQADLKTLLLEEQPQAEAVKLARANIGNEPVTTLSKPGDNKDGYDSKDYHTRSKALISRRGQATDLFKIVQRPPLGLPALDAATRAGLSAEKIALGRKLFFDRRLSLNDTFSCAMCHVPEQGFTSNEMKTSVGVEGRSVRRNAPTLYNTAYPQLLFHDGREFQLEEQIWAPLLAHNEMANPSVGYVLQKIRALPDYQGQFEAIYQRDVSMQNLGDAFAAYQRALLSADSAFDRWYYGKEENALSTRAKQGFRLFTGKAGCAVCHSITETHAVFSDDKLHNTGIGYQNSMGIRPAKRKVALAPGVFVDVEQRLIDTFSEPAPKDLGLYEITQNPADRWKYKTPGLRNIALTAPYMHDGTFSTLHDVVDFYNQGGIANPGLSPLIKPLDLDATEVDALVTFMNALTGSNVDELVADAFAAPVGDITRTDPNWANQLTVPLAGETLRSLE